ncbi:hypothetical protein JM79_2753 [Gramella sp. Hel_I_59]|uniref:hypothetical protein n=1 Tax=Gramella sp. Hel_I_59 TaxID=1249978 RepID=UPI0011516F3F|nr:hypothetical protein [Gramella sp. Hel_I_59]TQI71804.1 hypothetical protein JM79_2753 [Gramella sp. Hel_I_59]
MNEISEWFKDQDYDKGVELYSKLPNAKTRVLSTLKRGRNDKNLATICRALRVYKQAEPAKAQVKKISKPKLVPKPAAPEVEMDRKAVIHQSAGSYFKKIKYAELPPELRVRYKQLKDLFYAMCDLHFLWLDLPDEAEEEALKLQLEIFSLDEQRDTIWKELDHWDTYRTILPTKSSEDFSGLSPKDLYLKKANTASSISKMEKRIDGWYKNMEAEPNQLKKRKIAQQINNSEKKLHQHEINLQKILELL